MATGWYLEKRTGSSDKFYAVVVGDGFTAARWGRRGTAGQAGAWPDSRGHDRVRSKLRDGYREVVDHDAGLVATDPDTAVETWLDTLRSRARRDVAELLATAADMQLWVVPGFGDCAERNPAGAAIADELAAAGAVVARTPAQAGDVALLAMPDRNIVRLRRSWPVTLHPVGDVVAGDGDEVLATALAIVGDANDDTAAWMQALQAARALQPDD